MRARLDKVSVVGTDFVTLSGGSGIVTVTLVNQPRPADPRRDPAARHRLRRTHRGAEADRDLAPGQRSVIRLRAHASSIGVHEVTLTPVTEQGGELGSALTFSLRTSQVGRLIWLVLVGGGALLVAMILRRVLRGLREHRWRGQ